jgi:hypothetical protein
MKEDKEGNHEGRRTTKEGKKKREEDNEGRKKPTSFPEQNKCQKGHTSAKYGGSSNIAVRNIQLMNMFHNEINVSRNIPV